MENEGIESLVNLIKRIEITDENKAQVNKMKELIKQKRYIITPVQVIKGCLEIRFDMGQVILMNIRNHINIKEFFT